MAAQLAAVVEEVERERRVAADQVLECVGNGGALDPNASFARHEVREHARQLRIVFLAYALVAVFASTSFEAARAGQQWFTDVTAQSAMVTLWWAAFATALLVFGAVRRMKPLRWCGLILIAISLGKAVIFDLATVDAGWRVVSFLALGLLMLGVAAVYAKSTRRLVGRGTMQSFNGEGKGTSP